MRFFFKYFFISVFIGLIIIGFLLNCDQNSNQQIRVKDEVFIRVLGIAQDGGFPHINYNDEWNDLENGSLKREPVVSLGLVDMKSKQKWLFEATPDMPQQLYMLNKEFPESDEIVNGVFLTHAHIGHYTGLMHFGREAMGARNIPVYAMPRMSEFLQANGPWSQLVDLGNIEIKSLVADSSFALNARLEITPFLVPHRDEFSETVGYRIQGPSKSALFIPDINKWELWDRSIVEEVKKVDYAFLDATFFENGEINRPMSEVPHPFIVETMELFRDESDEVQSKIIFIHFNHSNPAIRNDFNPANHKSTQGFRFARTGDIFPL
ncbi:MAG: MBL fold metallo-hydrolase [Bacteroidia bacterium]|nr:MBL fold metallo-hydrolase [Bacteroidia bacterium]